MEEDDQHGNSDNGNNDGMEKAIDADKDDGIGNGNGDETPGEMDGNMDVENDDTDVGSGMGIGNGNNDNGKPETAGNGNRKVKMTDNDNGDGNIKMENGLTKISKTTKKSSIIRPTTTMEPIHVETRTMENSKTTNKTTAVFDQTSLESCQQRDNGRLDNYGGNLSVDSRAPNWNCKCGYRNYGFRQQCNSCRTFIEMAQVMDFGMSCNGNRGNSNNRGGGQQPGGEDWNCSCGYTNFAFRRVCNSCKYRRGDGNGRNRGNFNRGGGNYGNRGNFNCGCGNYGNRGNFNRGSGNYGNRGNFNRGYGNLGNCGNNHGRGNLNKYGQQQQQQQYNQQRSYNSQQSTFGTLNSHSTPTNTDNCLYQQPYHRPETDQHQGQYEQHGNSYINNFNFFNIVQLPMQQQQRSNSHFQQNYNQKATPNIEDVVEEDEIQVVYEKIEKRNKDVECRCGHRIDRGGEVYNICSIHAQQPEY
uniref:RanBP2-type domain-containing protein n=1 Tax=Panagrolaimus davidi TaxID=227884 RepID=A0A914QG24_9BILA